MKVLPCIECGSEALTLVSGREIYPHRPDLFEKMIWRCGCGAYVGCHHGTTAPLGRPAKRETHAARMKAHAAFDPTWRATQKLEGCSKKEARGRAYKRLAAALGIDRDACHIGHFDRETALRVVSVVEGDQAMTPSPSVFP